jgi:hypothetical protein
LIPKQPAGSIIHYYLYAADKSGHNATMPFMGPADPFTFTAIYTDITAIPDTLWFRTMNDLLEGKATRLHDFSLAGINLVSVQQNGVQLSWGVDSISVTGFPHLMSPGDSEYIHIRVPIPTCLNTPVYWVDTMNIVSELGNHRVIIMINSELYTGIPAFSGNRSSLVLYNYPNPFSNSTMISYQLPERTKVNLEVVNTMGRQVAILVNAEQDEGVYKVVLNTAEWSAGIYYLRIVTDKETAVKKMLRIR